MACDNSLGLPGDGSIGPGGSYDGQAVVPEALDGATEVHQGMVRTSSN